MYKYLALTILLAMGLSLLSGCGASFYLKEGENHKKVRKSGYELCHLRSCGPEAISHAYREMGKKVHPFKIGKEIQDAAIFDYRKTLSWIHHDFVKITCPIELKKYLRKKGFKVTTVHDFDQVAEGDVAIVLIKGRDDIRDWHYMTYPTHTKKQILNFFKEDTAFKSAYILE
ncbi:MAG: hypothetical protein CL512_05830 [Actinobacteria bacterium]|nr:hypothetical protein [Actinomycetota bacterium]|tara:strand:+ start:148 stop:663 length:516 start_codon:yes stop_codon:yes gene_type:complete